MAEPAVGMCACKMLAMGDSESMDSAGVAVDRLGYNGAGSAGWWMRRQITRRRGSCWGQVGERVCIGEACCTISGFLTRIFSLILKTSISCGVHSGRDGSAVLPLTLLYFICTRRPASATRYEESVLA